MRRRLFIALLVLLVGSSRAGASPILQSNPGNDFFVWWLVNLQGGAQTTIETTNLTPGSDSVLSVVRSDAVAPGGYLEIAYNDDADSTLRSSVTFTPPATGNYRVWVRGWSSSTGGRADIRVNGVTQLFQLPFGGTRTLHQYAAGDRFDVVGERKGVCTSFPCIFPDNDYLLFLSAFGHYQQMDDNSGTNEPVARGGVRWDLEHGGARRERPGLQHGGCHAHQG
jgi:hypothetical protein